MSNKAPINITGEFAWMVVSGKGLQNYNKDGFDYTGTVIVSGEDAQNVANQLKALMGDTLSEKGMSMDNVPFRLLTDKKADDGSLAYELVKLDTPSFDNLDKKARYGFRFRNSTINGFTGKPQVIGIHDAKGVETTMPEGMGIGNGSKGVIFGTAVAYTRGRKCGVSLYLDKVQITDLKEFHSSPHKVEEKQGTFDVSAQGGGEAKE